MKKTVQIKVLNAEVRTKGRRHDNIITFKKFPFGIKKRTTWVGGYVIRPIELVVGGIYCFEYAPSGHISKMELLEKRNRKTSFWQS